MAKLPDLPPNVSKTVALGESIADLIPLCILIRVASLDVGISCWPVLRLGDRARVCVETLLWWPVIVVWRVSIHCFHIRAVAEGNAKRDWFRGILW